MGTFARRVKTGPGTTAVQSCTNAVGGVLSMEHVGSAHGEIDLALLSHVAHERIHAGQDELPLGRITW